jgi:hypothetical protein
MSTSSSQPSSHVMQAHEDVVGTTPVEIPFYKHVSFSQMDNPLNDFILLGKDIVFQVALDLCDPCIGTDLSRVTLRTEVWWRANREYGQWWSPYKWSHRGRWLCGAGWAPRIWCSWPDGRVRHVRLQHHYGHMRPHRCHDRQLVHDRI